MSAYLERMTTATRMLAEIGSAQDAWDVARLAEAARTLAKMQSLGVEASNHATAIKAKAMLRLADLVDEDPDYRPGRPTNPSRREGFPTPRVVHDARQLRAGLTDDDIERAAENANKAGREVGVKRLLRVARENVAEQRRREPVTAVTTVTDVTIHHGDFREALTGLYPESVDAIITDPPYTHAMFAYGDGLDALGAMAAKVLKPNGVLAVMFGTGTIPEATGVLNRHLSFRWCVAWLTPGPRARMHHVKVGTGWKPIYLYERPDSQTERWLLDDVVTSAGDDKDHHRWGQDLAGFSQLVERLTVPGALVVDPFLGGGTTAVACKNLGRRFIGCDVDAAAVQIARERVA